MDKAEVLRRLPKVDVLLASPELRRFPRAVAKRAAREALEAARKRALDGEGVVPQVIVADVVRRAERARRPGLRPVVNATGVLLHTNLGRAPWSEEARAAVSAVTKGWCNLELMLDQGGVRGGRGAGAEQAACRVTGAEAALVVNNCAAAVLLAVTAIAAGREVIVSRGELVEIGGGFRVPDVISACGARLREVGTTNRTRAADVSAAVGEQTAAILVVHRSNFQITGFTSSPTVEELVGVAAGAGVPLLVDAGSGALDGGWGAEEPVVPELVAAGADLVMFSADKLLGGPQAGVIVGREAWIARLRRHPLMRALRVDKATLAALEATLRGWEEGGDVPIRSLRDATLGALRARAAAMAEAIGDGCEVVEVDDTPGGGAAPGARLKGVAVALAGDAEAWREALLAEEPAIVGRVAEGRMLLALRSLLTDDDSVVVETVRRVASGRSTR